MRRVESAARVVRIEPVRAQSVEADFAVPLRISVAIGVGVGGLACVRVAWDVAVLIGGAVWLLAFVGQVVANRALLWGTEYALGIDLDGDGAKGEPTPSEHLYEIHQDDEAGRAHVNRMTLRTDPGKLALFADAALKGQSLGIASWTGAGRPFSRGEFEAMRDELILHGYAERVGKGTNAPWSLTARGRSLCKRIARREGES